MAVCFLEKLGWRYHGGGASPSRGSHCHLSPSEQLVLLVISQVTEHVEAKVGYHKSAISLMKKDAMACFTFAISAVS